MYVNSFLTDLILKAQILHYQWQMRILILQQWFPTCDPSIPDLLDRWSWEVGGYPRRFLRFQKSLMKTHFFSLNKVIQIAKNVGF